MVHGDYDYIINNYMYMLLLINIACVRKNTDITYQLVNTYVMYGDSKPGSISCLVSYSKNIISSINRV